MMRVILWLLFLCWGTGASATNFTIQNNIASLRVLDKITARVTDMDIGVGQRAHFGTIAITVRRCLATPEDEAPEATVFLEIMDQRPDILLANPKGVLVYRGWMFASSPAISAMEHSVYDLWLVGCKGKGNSKGAQ